MYYGSPYFSPEYFLSPYWDTGAWVPPVVIPPGPDDGGGGGGGAFGRVYGEDDDTDKLKFILKARADDGEIIEVITMIVESGVLNQ